MFSWNWSVLTDIIYISVFFTGTTAADVCTTNYAPPIIISTNTKVVSILKCKG